MSFTWIAGEASNVPITWTNIEAICEVDPDRELVSTDFEVVTLSLGFAGYFDNFSFQRNRTEEKTIGSDIAQLLIESSSSSNEFSFPAFAGFTDCSIVAAHIVPQENIVGADGDYCQLRLVNKTTSDVLGTKTFTLGNDIDAFEIGDFGGISEELIEAGDVIAIEKENTGSGMALPQFLLAIEWNLA